MKKSNQAKKSEKSFMDMAIAKAELIRREYQRNPFKVIRNGLLKIKTADGQYKKLEINPIQDKLLTLIEKKWKEKKPIFLWILKARQEGVSTLVEALIYVLTSFRKNINSLILSDDIDGSNYLFDMSKLYHRSLRELDPLLVPDIKKSNAKELVFEGTRSQILIDTAKNLAAGRKYTFQIIHLSEIAFYDHASELMTGLLQTVHNVPGILVIGETTANGVGGYFYEQWQRATQKYSDWVPVFFPWFALPEYSLDFESKRHLKELQDTFGKDHIFNDFEGEEKELTDKFGCDLKQINWRRWCIKNKCDGSLDKFHQEYPAFAEQSFLVSGRPRFNVKILSIMRQTCKDPVSVGYLQESKDGYSIEDNKRGYLKIFNHPIKGRRYIIGGDVAEGLIKVDSKKESDFSCLQVLDRRTLEQVAIWHGRLDPDLFGIEAIKLAKYYNNAFIGIERNSSGLTTVTRIKNENYWLVYQTTIFDEILDREEKKLGWITTSRTKPLIIDDLARMIREHSIKINDKDTVSECMSYVIDENGKTNAQEGCFDDRVMALAIGVQMIHAWPDSSDKARTPEETPHTFAWYVKQAEKRKQEEVII